MNSSQHTYLCAKRDCYFCQQMEKAVESTTVKWRALSSYQRKKVRELNQALQLHAKEQSYCYPR